jgi:hypothetical protein
MCNTCFKNQQLCNMPTTCTYGFLKVNNNINQLIFVMVKCGVLFEVRTEFLSTIYTSFGF